jgi:hypothetical protein
LAEKLGAGFDCVAGGDGEEKKASKPLDASGFGG